MSVIFVAVDMCVIFLPETLGCDITLVRSLLLLSTWQDYDDEDDN